MSLIRHAAEGKHHHDRQQIALQIRRFQVELLV